MLISVVYGIPDTSLFIPGDVPSIFFFDTADDAKILTVIIRWKYLILLHIWIPFKHIYTRLKCRVYLVPLFAALLDKP